LAQSSKKLDLKYLIKLNINDLYFSNHISNVVRIIICCLTVPSTTCNILDLSLSFYNIIWTKEKNMQLNIIYIKTSLDRELIMMRVTCTNFNACKRLLTPYSDFWFAVITIYYGNYGYYNYCSYYDIYSYYDIFIAIRHLQLWVLVVTKGCNPGCNP